MKLIIGNKAYSSWSMRGWLAAKRTAPGLAAVMRFVGIACGDDLRAGLVQERVHHAHAPTTTADEAHGDAIARRRFARLAKHR